MSKKKDKTNSKDKNVSDSPTDLDKEIIEKTNDKDNKKKKKTKKQKQKLKKEKQKTNKNKEKQKIEKDKEKEKIEDKKEDPKKDKEKEKDQKKDKEKEKRNKNKDKQKDKEKEEKKKEKKTKKKKQEKEKKNSGKKQKENEKALEDKDLETKKKLEQKYKSQGYKITKIEKLQLNRSLNLDFVDHKELYLYSLKKPVSVFLTKENENKLYKENHDFITMFITAYGESGVGGNVDLLNEKHRLYGNIESLEKEEKKRNKNKKKKTKKKKQKQKKNEEQVKLTASHQSIRSLFRGLMGNNLEEKIVEIISQIKILNQKADLLENEYKTSIAIKRDQLSQELKIIDHEILQLSGEFKNRNDEDDDENVNENENENENENGNENENENDEEPKISEEDQQAILIRQYRIQKIFEEDLELENQEKKLHTQYRVTLKEIKNKRKILQTMKKELSDSQQKKELKEKRKLKKKLDKSRKLKSSSGRIWKIKRKKKYKYPFIHEIVEELVLGIAKKIDSAEKISQNLLKVNKNQMKKIQNLIKAISRDDNDSAVDIIKEISKHLYDKENWDDWEIEKKKDSKIPPPPPMQNNIPTFNIPTSSPPVFDIPQMKKTTTNKLDQSTNISKKIPETKSSNTSLFGNEFFEMKNKLKKVDRTENRENILKERKTSLLSLINSGLREKFTKNYLWGEESSEDDQFDTTESSESSDFD
ncbi:zinc finger cchc domain-containing protein [Anaeramoeba flamelloides]|uniref:Zinc finger cchc domain-containing protein n=1 Tax=Anaeramoeba flamelloides TaxID=1746091 RepID=A0ABQ8YYV8_9EUKA|nr:zinc finger cchc domain-containing protein [Anaeramoeba flamelloides]